MQWFFLAVLVAFVELLLQLRERLLSSPLKSPIRLADTNLMEPRAKVVTSYKEERIISIHLWSIHQPATNQLKKSTVLRYH